PWRGTQLTRTTWIEEMQAEGVDIPMFDGSQEYLYWVGCTGALQERNVKVTKALVRLFLEAGVSFGVLGGEEGCSGDPARRLGQKSATYHGPCYISRHYNTIDEPRSVLAATGASQVEMKRCKRGTFCCGAGGSHMWVEENRGTRINDARTTEAVDTGADLIAVACPFCMQMFESSAGNVPAAVGLEHLHAEGA